MAIINYYNLHYGTIDSTTVAVDADYFVAVNVAYVVTAFDFIMYIYLFNIVELS